jgi:hypothetical protein
MAKQQALIPLTPIWRADLAYLRGLDASEVDPIHYDPSDLARKACNERFANDYVDFYQKKKRVGQREFQSRLDKAGWISREVRAHIAEQWNLYDRLKDVAGYKDVIVIIRGVKYNRVRGPKGYFVGQLIVTPEGTLQPAKKLVPVRVLMEASLARMLAKEAKRERQRVVSLLKALKHQRAVASSQQRRTREAIRKGKFKL